MADRSVVVSYPRPDADTAPEAEAGTTPDTAADIPDEGAPFERLSHLPPPTAHPKTSPFRYYRSHDVAPAAHAPTLQDRNLPVLAAPPNPAQVWAALTAANPNPAALERNRLTGGDAQSGAVSAHFDVLRTRMLQAMADHGWTRVAVTAPTPGCGATFVSAALALSMARLPNVRTALIDFDLRDPGLAATFGIPAPGPIEDMLSGVTDFAQHFRRVGLNLALALNSAPVAEAAACLQTPETVEALDILEDALCPDMILFNLPPALVCDDVIAFLPQVDAVLLVIDGTRTLAEDVAACEKLFEGRKPLMGVVHNRSELRRRRRYIYRGK